MSLFQNECKSKYPDGIGHDEIADVKGGKMKCKRIYFVALPLYGSKGSEEQVCIRALDKRSI